MGTRLVRAQARSLGRSEPGPSPSLKASPISGAPSESRADRPFAEPTCRDNPKRRGEGGTTERSLARQPARNAERGADLLRHPHCQPRAERAQRFPTGDVLRRRCVFLHQPAQQNRGAGAGCADRRSAASERGTRPSAQRARAARSSWLRSGSRLWRKRLLSLRAQDRLRHDRVGAVGFVHGEVLRPRRRGDRRGLGTVPGTRGPRPTNRALAAADGVTSAGASTATRSCWPSVAARAQGMKLAVM